MSNTELGERANANKTGDAKEAPMLQIECGECLESFDADNEDVVLCAVKESRVCYRCWTEVWGELGCEDCYEKCKWNCENEDYAELRYKKRY